jgi:hypothetical protein
VRIIVVMTLRTDLDGAASESRLRVAFAH